MKIYRLLLISLSVVATACDSIPPAAPRQPNSNVDAGQPDSNAEANSRFQRFIPVTDSRMPAAVLALDSVTGQLCKTVAQELAASVPAVPTCLSLAKVGLVDYVFDPATGTLKKTIDPYEEYLKRTRSKDPLGLFPPPNSKEK